MFYLSSKLYHIDAGLANNYIFNFSIVREFDSFLLLLELYKLRLQDEFTLNIVVKHCTEHPTRLSLLDKVDNQLQDSLKISYYEVENYLPTLEYQKDYINRNYTDNKLINFKIFNEQFKVIFNKQQINRFYCDVNSFYSNYIVLESLYRLTINNDNGNDKTNNDKIVNINEHRDSLKKENNKQQEEKEHETNIELPKQKSVESQDNTRLDDIFNLCINQVLKSFLIHITTNYYIYFNDDQCYLNEDTYYAPNLYPSVYIFNSSYFKSLLNSLSNHSVQNVKMRAEKVLKKLKEESDNLRPLEKLVLINILFLYYLRLVQETHTEYLNNNIVKIFNDCQLQTRLLNNHTKTYFSNIDLKFEIKEISIDDIQDSELDQEILEISDQYKHLTSVSEKDFIDKVLKDLNESANNQYEDLKLNKKSIINLNELTKNHVSDTNKEQLNESKLINTDMLIENDNKITQLFTYDSKLDYLTEAYGLFDQYVKNPSMFTMQLKREELEISNTPKTVINLFETLKNILYDNEINIQNYFNTYDYYKILCNNLNDASSFPHYILLFIIYQIIIPHLYMNYNMCEFENVLN